jgi:hypothetical protein
VETYSSGNTHPSQTGVLTESIVTGTMPRFPIVNENRKVCPSSYRTSYAVKSSPDGDEKSRRSSRTLCRPGRAGPVRGERLVPEQIDVSGPHGSDEEQDHRDDDPPEDVSTRRVGSGHLGWPGHGLHAADGTPYPCWSPSPD